MIATTVRTALIVATGCLLLTGCGPAKPAASATGAHPPATAGAATTPAAAPPAGGDGLTACQLVTEQDASAALGSPAGPGTPGGTAALSECIYADGSLIVGMKADSKALFDSSRTAALGKGAKDIPGVGDSAFEAGTSGYSTLEFVKGTTLVSVLLSGDDAPAKATAVATTAAAKL